MQMSVSATTKTFRQAWLSSSSWDVLYIISPAFISSLIALTFKTQIESVPNMPLWAWVCLVLVVDVAHVYATLFRTYMDRQTLEKNATLLMAIPGLCWIVGVTLYTLDGLLFWRVLAYLAVFHFIRQQYGFMILYSRHEPDQFRRFKWLDCACIYIATIYPLLFWHTHLPRNFSWFIGGDFIETVPSIVANAGGFIYAVAAVCYLAKELALLKTTGFINIPRNLIVLGTAISWWVGIISLNSDLAFTMTNVLSHGIPYMALVWLYHHNRDGDSDRDRSEEANKQPAKREIKAAKSFSLSKVLLTHVPLFLLFLITLAYLEEGLWDGFVWREHLHFFLPFSVLPSVSDTAILALLVPLLALPQSTHYVLDGFIWRVKDRTSSWSA
jgi:hypothetical protein